ncbi:MAG TPA: ComF family protein [Candidatus Marinimicrobia bacterium]|nr:ComF family protein [Candidatus Neomarinimicrobiota bacterium]
MANFAHILQKAPFLDLLFPPRCVVCGHYAGFEPFLCRDCFHKLSFFGESPFSIRDNADWEKIPVSAMLEFNTPLRRLAHSLKYQSMPYVGSFLGRLMGQFYQGSAFENAQLIVPVPLHPVKQRDRGYNQAEWLGIGLQQIWQSPLTTRALKRIRYTVTQTKLGQDERQKNISAAFLADEKLVHGKKVLLLDDIFTTGATTGEAAQTLLKAGASQVMIICAATPLANRYIRFEDDIDFTEEPKEEIALVYI